MPESPVIPGMYALVAGRMAVPWWGWPDGARGAADGLCGVAAKAI
ncbi:MAG: hypothetical protein ACP5QR_15465 [Rhizomicrobium sp.]